MIRFLEHLVAGLTLVVLAGLLWALLAGRVIVSRITYLVTGGCA